MARYARGQAQLPIQPVENPILCKPYVEPQEHWVYDQETGAARREDGRRPASYWWRTQRTRTQQLALRGLTEEQREELPMVNHLRADVARWRKSEYEGATQVTKTLLKYWWREDRPRRLFYCQLEAAETIIFLNEIRLPGRYLRFRPQTSETELLALPDRPLDPAFPPLTRLGVKMATGSGKTVVMAMLIAWAFCNRAQVPSDVRFPLAALVLCPNLTIKERLQVLRPERADNYYDAFDLLPGKCRDLLNQGKVKVTNWHQLAEESEHIEGGRSYTVVNKGPEGDEAYARRVLEDLYPQAPIMVLNDEAHHAWRPNPEALDEKLSRETERELRTATVWIDGLDRLNRAVGVRLCADLSATPFYIQGSGYIEGSPFPWLVSDFGLVDAIESGIVKIPRLPVNDTTGRPEPRYFRLWQNIVDELQPGEKVGRRPKPDAIYREAQPALRMLAGQWVERYKAIEAADNTKDKTPPALIVVCANTDIAQVFYERISGEREIEVEEPGRGGKMRRRKKTAYGTGDIFAEYFSNTETFKPTVRIDSKLLAQAESGDPKVSRSEAAERLRRIVATVGVPGQPGEQVRCVVSVAMLNEGWDAHNVTNILGVRAFDSQLLCEQVVGRGLRRMNYDVDPATEKFSEEYVDIYGVPFTLIPFKGRDVHTPEPGDRPKNHVRALEERASWEMRFPVVEGYAFALRRNLITADLATMEPLRIEPEREPTAVFVQPRVGYQVGGPLYDSPGESMEQTRQEYYDSTHIQTIAFEIARRIVENLTGDGGRRDGAQGPGLGLTARHQLFPQVLRLVYAYIWELGKVDFRGEHPCELGQEKYVQRLVGLFLAAIRPDESQGEPPLLPILNRHLPIGTTADVNFMTVRPCFVSHHSHVNLVAADTERWEQSAAYRIEQAVRRGTTRFYARNDGLELVIPYEFQGLSHNYEPDYLVRLANDVTLVLEIKGLLTEADKAKHQAAQRWCAAVSNWGKLGQWAFHVCRDPQMLVREIGHLAKQG